MFPVSALIPVGISIEITKVFLLLINLIKFLIFEFIFLFKPIPKTQSIITGLVFFLSSFFKSYKL